MYYKSKMQLFVHFTNLIEPFLNNFVYKNLGFFESFNLPVTIQVPISKVIATGLTEVELEELFDRQCDIYMK